MTPAERRALDATHVEEVFVGHCSECSYETGTYYLYSNADSDVIDHYLHSHASPNPGNPAIPNG